MSHVVELAPERVFSWVVVPGDDRFGGTADPVKPIATWSFRLEPRDGGTWLRQTVLLGPARSGLSRAIDRCPDKRDRIIEHRLTALRAGMQTTVDGIKALAERS